MIAYACSDRNTNEISKSTINKNQYQFSVDFYFILTFIKGEKYFIDNSLNFCSLFNI